MEKATTYFMSLSNIYLKCLGIHQNVLGTKQDYQDIVPDFKNTQSSKLILLNGHKQQNLQLWAFSQPDVPTFPSLFCGSGEYMQRRSLEINNKPNKQKAEC